MKPITRLLLTGGLTMLLLACDSGPQTDRQAATPATPVEPAAVATTPVAEATALPMPVTGKYVIDLSSGNVSIRANQADARQLLNELATLAKFRLLTGDIDWQTVTVDIRAPSLHAALGELLQQYHYQIVYARDEDTRQEVLREVVIGEPSATGTGTTAGTDTAAGSKALPGDNEARSADGQQQAYIQALQDPKSEARLAAAEEVEPVGDAFYLLTDMLQKDPSPEVRIATAGTLEESEDPLAVDALVKCLQDGEPDVIMACIEALDTLGDETTAQHLEPLLTHYHPGVNSAAADAIESLQ